jgi:hypothetical protein
MIPNLLYIERVEQARRKENERRAAHWRQLGMLPARPRKGPRLVDLWRRFVVLARPKDRHMPTARLNRHTAR